MRTIVTLVFAGLVVYGCADSSDRTTGGNASGGTGGASGTGGTGGSQIAGGTASSGRAGKGGTGGGAGHAAGHGGSAGARAGGGDTNAGAGDGNISGDGGGGSSGGRSTDRGCASPSAWSSSLIGCEGGYVHRPSDAACALSPHEGAAGDGSTGGGAGEASVSLYPCQTDDDCTGAPDGYCIDEDPAGYGAHCVYACRTDADCGSGQLCACDDSKISVQAQTHVSLGLCVRAACRTDDECDAGSLCVASLESACLQVPKTTPDSFHCQSPADECNGAADCEDRVTEGEAYRFRCSYRGSHTVCGNAPGC